MKIDVRYVNAESKYLSARWLDTEVVPGLGVDTDGVVFGARELPPIANMGRLVKFGDDLDTSVVGMLNNVPDGVLSVDRVRIIRAVVGHLVDGLSNVLNGVAVRVGDVPVEGVQLAVAHAV